ncbi:MAG: PrsW family intramembrane metalloprotease [Anaerolineae bacterium]|nr:PrsW family intramembrane metalloprotease [Anaerolineae bacterium]
MALAVMLETLFAATLLTLVFDLANSIANNIGTLSQALMGKNITGAVATSGFVFIFIQITIVAPVVEELAKPLVTLPVIGRLSSSGAFLMGAMAGAGFAMLENIVYAGLGFSFWAGILLIRGIGAAIHPLGSGLVAQGWRDVLRREKNAGARWFARFGLATGIHLLWNLSSLLLIMLVGAQFFNELPRGINVLGLLAAGTILVLLIGLGIATLWIGRAISQKKFQSAAFIKPEKLEVSFIFSDRAVAIWAVVCLVATIPVGIIGWQLLIR